MKRKMLLTCLCLLLVGCSKDTATNDTGSSAELTETEAASMQPAILSSSEVETDAEELKTVSEDLIEDNEEHIEYTEIEGDTGMPEEANEILIPRYSYEYYISENEFCSKKPEKEFSLTKKLSEPNDIIDEEDWFNDNEIEPIDSYYICDDKYTYYLDGEDTDPMYGSASGYPSKAIVYDEFFETVATLDFANYRYPDEYTPDDKYFVEERINHINSVDDVIYVSISHMTYADTGAHNGYVVAIDMNTWEPLWQSEPLVTNASNFVVYDDYIITGYGFTAEPDYIYVLDRYTGKVVAKEAVKSKPDYFAVKDNLLYVRCYDTNYIFEMN